MKGAFFMPLKKVKKVVKANPNPVDEGDFIQTPDHQVLAMTHDVPLQLVTLNANQFYWPTSWVVMTKRRIQLPEKDPLTGWNKKDENGNKILTDQYADEFDLADADLAETVLEKGGVLDSLPTLTCTVYKDKPLQDYVEQESTIKLVKPNVMLWFGSGHSLNGIRLVAQDCELV